MAFIQIKLGHIATAKPRTRETEKQKRKQESQWRGYIATTKNKLNFKRIEAVGLFVVSSLQTVRLVARPYQERQSFSWHRLSDH